MFLVEKQVGNQNLNRISLTITEELIFEVPRSQALIAIAQNGNFEKLDFLNEYLSYFSSLALTRNS